jgi:hypothetical protein
MKNYYGVIEDRGDPKQLGRVRVRVLGIHTEDKVLLPTSDLPWATVLSHDGSNSGFGTTPSFFVEGTWVLVGFFDTDRQEPYVMGGIAGIPKDLGNPDVGFNDPNKRTDDETKSVYPKVKEVSDVHENARGSNTAANPVARDTIRKTAVATADFDSMTVSTVTGSITVSASDGSTFDEPRVVDDTLNSKPGTYRPTYPKNHVFNTESGHLFEFDDTDSYKRILLSHASGSYQEYSNDGTYVSHIVSKMFEVVSSDKSSLIEGDSVETIDKGLKLKVNKLGASGNHYDIEVGANASMNVMIRSGDLNLNVTGNVNLRSSADTNIDCANFRVAATGAVKITSGTGDIDLN